MLRPAGTGMTRWRRAFDRIGGPDAVTWPAFWITFAANITAHLTTGGSVNAPIWVRILVVLASQLAMFTPLVVLRFTVLRNPPRPRPWIAVAGFIVAAITRSVALTSILIAIEAVENPMWGYRIVASLQSQAVLLFIIALVIGTMRAHTRSLQELLTIQQELTATEQRIITDFNTRNDSELTRVKDRLRHELTAFDSKLGADSVKELQRVASDVVRPLSHELARALPVLKVSVPPVRDVHISLQQVLEQVVIRPPFRPLFAALLMTMFLFTASIAIFQSNGALLITTTFTSVFFGSWLANVSLRYLLPRLPPRLSLAAVVVSGTAIGFFVSGVIAWVLRETDVATIMLWAGGIFTTVIVLLIAVVSAVLQQQRDSENTLRDFTERLHREVIRMRQAQWLQQKALSRALHGPLQSAVTSAALRLDAAVRAGEPIADLVTDIRADLRSAIDVLEVAEHTAPSLETAFARIIGTWEGICSVTFDISDHDLSHVQSDPFGSATVIDIVTEAVSNAVKHGGASQVDVFMSVDGNGVAALAITDNGQSTDAPSPSLGLGTTVLDECTLSWRRTVDAEGHQLTADIPTAAKT
jgi:signal transduction histidine kinase